MRRISTPKPVRGPVIERRRKNRTEEGWNSATRARLARLQAGLVLLRQHWPLTVRQLFYHVLGKGEIDNNRGEYGKVSRDLVKARLQGIVPWEAIEDRGRPILETRGCGCLDEFIEVHVEAVFSGYRRHPSLEQPVGLEVWVEKDAVSRIVERAAWPYGVPVVVDRGYSSISQHHEARLRILGHADAGRPVKILYFGDLDPSGEDMVPSIEHTLSVEMGLAGLFEIERCALLPEQVRQYRLPISIAAIKKGDTRAAKYCEHYGDLAVELDALPPDVLQQIVVGRIEENLDLDIFDEQRQIGEREREWMEAAIPKVRDAISSALDQIGGRP
jgi:hypothetical protein